MNSLPEIKLEYLESTLVDLLNIPSPTGYTDQIFYHLEELLKEYPVLNINRTAKGGLTAIWDCGRPAGAHPHGPRPGSQPVAGPAFVQMRLRSRLGLF